MGLIETNDGMGPLLEEMALGQTGIPTGSPINQTVIDQKMREAASERAHTRRIATHRNRGTSDDTYYVGIPGNHTAPPVKNKKFPGVWELLYGTFLMFILVGIVFEGFRAIATAVLAALF